jgi:hypothetical protein
MLETTSQSGQQMMVFEMCRLSQTSSLTMTIFATVALVACTNQSDLDAMPAQRSLMLNENYQAVYARTNIAMRNCNSAGTAAAVVDGQLYPELGYGEVTFGAANISGFSPLNYIRIDREGDGALVSLKSLTSTPESSLNWLEYWTKGGTTCPVVSYAEIPPAL